MDDHTAYNLHNQQEQPGRIKFKTPRIFNEAYNILNSTGNPTSKDFTSKLLNALVPNTIQFFTSDSSGSGGKIFNAFTKAFPIPTDFNNGEIKNVMHIVQYFIELAQHASTPLTRMDSVLSEMFRAEPVVQKLADFIDRNYLGLQQAILWTNAVEWVKPYRFMEKFLSTPVINEPQPMTITFELLSIYCIEEPNYFLSVPPSSNFSLSEMQYLICNDRFELLTAVFNFFDKVEADVRRFAAPLLLTSRRLV